MIKAKLIKGNKLFNIITCVIIGIIGYSIIYNDSFFFGNTIYEDVNYQVPSITLLFNFYDGMSSIIPTMLLLLLIPFVSNFRTHIWRTENVDQQVVVRIGWRKYLVKEFLRSIKDIWYLPIVINVTIILLITFTVHLFPVINDAAYNPYFYKSAWIDVAVFTFLQIIGWSMLNLLCLVFSQLITNKYLYPFSLLLGTLAITFFVSFLTNFSFRYDWLLTALSPFNLLAPGVISLLGAPNTSARLLTILLSFALYGSLICWLFHYIIRRNEKNG